TDPALPTTSRGPCSPITTVGAIMLVRRRPGVAGPGATRSYSPSMLFRWIPVPGTITPEPDPVDDEIEHALPSASTAETCVVPAGAGSWLPGSDAAMRARPVRTASGPSRRRA